MPSDNRTISQDAAELNAVEPVADGSGTQAVETEGAPLTAEEPVGAPDVDETTGESGDASETTPDADADADADAEAAAAAARKRRRQRRRRRKKGAQNRLRREGRKVFANITRTISDEVAIEFDHVTKVFKLYKSDLDHVLGFFGSKRGLVAQVNANDDLSFVIHKGEAVALIGRNGAGKSTALKMISGVAHPTKGTVTVNGRVSALLELNAGFDGKLTGRENLRLRSQLMGMSREEFALIEEEVIEFAELGVYIDQATKDYSSGMKARLGFALAASVKPEILVIDEALSVGDLSFRNKCLDRMREIISRDGVTVLFVTHNANAAKEFCDRGIVLDHGIKYFDGDIREAIAYYRQNFGQRAMRLKAKEAAEKGDAGIGALVVKPESDDDQDAQHSIYPNEDEFDEEDENAEETS